MTRVPSLALLACAAAAASCGSSGGAGNGAGDGGPSDASIEARAESGTPETGPTMNCGAVAPSGTQIVASTTPLTVRALTPDGKYVLYEDPEQVLYTVPVGGGTPTKLAAATGTVSANGTGGALFFPFFEDAGEPQLAVGPLWAWTAATGAREISTSATASAPFDMSSDDAYVVYFATTDGTTATLTVSKADGSTKASLVPNIDLTGACPAVVRFDKTTIVAAYCLTNPGDAGTSDAFVSTFSAPLFNQTSIGTFPFEQINTLQLLTNAAGTELLLAGASGLALYPTDGGAPTVVDPRGVRGLFAPDDDVVYVTGTGTLTRYASAGGSKTVLLASGTYTPQRISPDGSWLQLYNDLSPMGQYPSVYLASAVLPGMPTAEWSATATTVLGFSTDSSFELFEASSGSASTDVDLYASPVAGGAPTKIVSTSSVALLAGSRVAATDNPAGTTMADIEVFDLGTPGQKTTVVTRAGTDFAVTPGGASIVYSWACEQSAQAGIWVAAP